MPVQQTSNKTEWRRITRRTDTTDPRLTEEIMCQWRERQGIQRERDEEREVERAGGERGRGRAKEIGRAEERNKRRKGKASWYKKDPILYKYMYNVNNFLWTKFLFCGSVEKLSLFFVPSFSSMSFRSLHTRWSCGMSYFKWCAWFNLMVLRTNAIRFMERVRWKKKTFLSPNFVAVEIQIVVMILLLRQFNQ